MNKTWCQTCFLFPESQEHIFQCIDIRKRLKIVNFDGVSCDMSYKNCENQEKFAKIYHLMIQIRKDMMRKSSSDGGPLHQ